MKKYRIRNVNYGWNKRKHDILLCTLPETKKKLLFDYKFFRWIKGDVHAFEVIFRVIDEESHEKAKTKIYWNPYTERCSTVKELYEDSNLVDWDCAICKTGIMCRMDSKKIENFICQECTTAHNSTNKTVDSRIIQSSLDFNYHCKHSLKGEQKEFIKYTRKSLKR
tara:strand:- start:12034 stop:12531 length:498 start_codon:yes stop_codon:yes gene_type:complete